MNQKLLFEKHSTIIVETILCKRSAISHGVIEAAKCCFWHSTINANDYVLIRKMLKFLSSVSDFSSNDIYIPENIENELSLEEKKIFQYIFSVWKKDNNIVFAMPELIKKYRKNEITFASYIKYFTIRGAINVC